MIPIVTAAEMAAIDAAAPEPVEVLIERAGAALARTAVRMMGGTYGRRVVVVAGKGSNGADGRVAARRLAARGARVTVVPATDAPARLPVADLVVDAAYGTGFRGDYSAPDAGGAAVLACDIPSGLDSLTGEDRGAVVAEATVTFAALKPGLLIGAGPEVCGEIEVADIGLDTSSATAHLTTRDDAVAALPRRARDAHKWQRAVRIVAGSPGMSGAAHLCAAGASRAGAGMVVVSSPGADAGDLDLPVEAVGRSLPTTGWVADVLRDVDRFAALVIGPGLGRSDDTLAAVRELLVEADLPVVVDADGLVALAEHPEVTRWRRSATVLTPHDGEYAVLAGAGPAADRLSAARGLAEQYRATVLLKGPTTLVAGRHGAVRAVTSGDARLATAGTGDVLSGVIGAVVDDDDRLPSVAAAAWLHGTAARRGPGAGLVSADLPELVAHTLTDVL